MDIIATFGDYPIITNIESTEYDLSHHFLVEFDVDVFPETQLYKLIKYRHTKKVNWDKFKKDIETGLTFSDTTPFEEGISEYKIVTSKVLDEHAPRKSRRVKVVNTAPWFDFEYVNLRKLRRKAERQYRRTGFLADKENYKRFRKQTTDLAKEKKTYILC